MLRGKNYAGKPIKIIYSTDRGKYDVSLHKPLKMWMMIMAVYLTTANYALED
jgi:hypothetical protein